MERRFVLFLTLSLAAITSCDEASGDRYDPSTYKKPGLRHRRCRTPHGHPRHGDTFYLYATEAVRNVPIMKSRDLVNWTLCGYGLLRGHAPRLHGRRGRRDMGPRHQLCRRPLSALLFALLVGAASRTAASASPRPKRPKDPGSTTASCSSAREIGCLNSIDPFFIEEDGAKYLFWGSFRGIWGAPAVGRRAHAGHLDHPTGRRHGFRGHIHPQTRKLLLPLRLDRQLLFRAEQHLFGRGGTPENLFGPYVDRNGEEMLSNNYETVLEGQRSLRRTGTQRRDRNRPRRHGLAPLPRLLGQQPEQPHPDARPGELDRRLAAGQRRLSVESGRFAAP